MNRIEELRRSRGLTQAELGKVIGVSRQAILNWENEIHSPNIEQLKKLADHFDVTLDYMLCRRQNWNKYKFILKELSEMDNEEIFDLVRKYVEKK